MYDKYVGIVAKIFGPKNQVLFPKLQMANLSSCCSIIRTKNLAPCQLFLKLNTETFQGEISVFNQGSSVVILHNCVGNISKGNMFYCLFFS